MRSITLLHTRRAGQLRALAQVRNTLPESDRRMVAELFSRCPSGTVDGLNDKELEHVDVMAQRHLQE